MRLAGSEGFCSAGADAGHRCADAYRLPLAANYLEIADIDTVTTNLDNSTANTFTDGLTVNGVMLPLNQFHFHSPSEHTINGAHYPLEMHMVHKLFYNTTTNATISANLCGTGATQCALKSAAVIGIMFAYECAHKNLSRLACSSSDIASCLLSSAARSATMAPS